MFRRTTSVCISHTATRRICFFPFCSFVLLGHTLKTSYDCFLCSSTLGDGTCEHSFYSSIRNLSCCIYFRDAAQGSRRRERMIRRSRFDCFVEQRLWRAPATCADSACAAHACIVALRGSLYNVAPRKHPPSSASAVKCPCLPYIYARRV